MKILKQYIFSLTLLALLIMQVSCKKSFLEIEPKGSLIARETKDYEQILNASYLASTFTASIYMGDEVAAQQEYFSGASLRVQRLFKYEDRVYQADELPNEITEEAGYIRRLYLYNKIINEVMDSKEGTEQQKNGILAEAKAGRAICNFMFLSDFSTPYNAATAAIDLGIPELTKADVTLTNFSRLTQKENYELIIKDLTEAIPNLGPLVHRRKISKLAAYFYLARIHMAMGNYGAATTELDAAFLERSKANIPLAIYDYNLVLDPNGVGTWFPSNGFYLSGIPQAANNTETIYNIEASSFQFGSANTFVYSPETAQSFSSTDKRPVLYDPVEFFGAKTFPLAMRRPTVFFTPIGPSLPDLYLMRSECRARANDLSGAVADVQVLREKRMSAAEATVPAATASNQQELVKFILKERTREFAFTGLRWLDMRRLSVDPIYKTEVDSRHQMYKDDGQIVNEYTLDPRRFALKFGERMLNESKGLQENL
ncbi:RagB/SusD family nutrient uptake outer membrane protein [Pedobacter sp. MC2016-14]|uniref:RagB/SusD family nutrient uptake outer membrane protein n=1 Tax=Pedobacter sp. MC2016-14 TaxID=2897327 RepID=UPI001E56E3C5|nr:RagB/SusD family nutrient uptake outer membrane protein [Pedobacter sp. MC2016-14]MCD0489177.1 RagB/SusD family nutrient uptake outer membrane protein [Pedobacter sp. MC2016-14]